MELGDSDMTTIVQFDKTYLTGTLTGINIPGQTITFPSYRLAQKYSAFLERVIRDGDFMRDAATGHRFTVSHVQVFTKHVDTPLPFVSAIRKSRAFSFT